MTSTDEFKGRFIDIYACKSYSHSTTRWSPCERRLIKVASAENVLHFKVLISISIESENSACRSEIDKCTLRLCNEIAKKRLRLVATLRFLCLCKYRHWNKRKVEKLAHSAPCNMSCCKCVSITRVRKRKKKLCSFELANSLFDLVADAIDTNLAPIKYSPSGYSTFLVANLFFSFLLDDIWRQCE